jgi:hypothetical protein
MRVAAPRSSGMQPAATTDTATAARASICSMSSEARENAPAWGFDAEEGEASNAFLSWSGARSKQVALVLRNRLPDVVQSLRPWMSDADISAGEDWAEVLARQLAENAVSIVCLTPENMREPWLLFEAGSLSNRLGKSRVCPYLIELAPTDVTGPLARFQSVRADREGTLKLVQSLNESLGLRGLPQQRLSDAFGRVWPDIEGELHVAAKADLPPVPPSRDQPELVKEILTIVRELQRRFDEGGLTRGSTVNGPPLVVPLSQGLGGKLYLGYSVKLAKDNDLHGTKRAEFQRLLGTMGMLGATNSGSSTYHYLWPVFTRRISEADIRIAASSAGVEIVDLVVPRNE